MQRVQLEIKNVQLFIEGDQNPVKSVRIEGRKDIFEHRDVKFFVEQRDARITSIRGRMRYNNTSYHFDVGYLMKYMIGKISVKKGGEKTGDLKPLQDAYDFLFELFKKYFINWDVDDPR